MFTSINTTVNTNAIISASNEILRDVIGAVGTVNFVTTFVEAYNRATHKKIFTLRQWRVLKEIFRDNESYWDVIFEKLDSPFIQFAESKNGDEDYNIFTVYRNHSYDHWNHGYERLVVKEN